MTDNSTPADPDVMERAALDRVADVFGEGGLHIPRPWHGDLDDVEQGAFDCFVAALSALCEGDRLPNGLVVRREDDR